MLSPISFGTEQQVLFLSVNVGHESCGCDIEIALCRLLSDDDSIELLEKLCLLRKFNESAESVVFVLGLSPEAQILFIFDLDKPFKIFLYFRNFVVRSSECSACVVFSLVVTVNSDMLSKSLSRHALCSSRLSYVS